MESYNAKNYTVAAPKFKEVYDLLKAGGEDNKQFLYYSGLNYALGGNKEDAINVYNELINSGYTGVRTTYNAKNKKSDSSKGTTVTFWNSFTGADGDMLVKMVDKFNKENTDGIKVKMDISSDFDSQLSTAFAAGEGPTMILSSSAYRFTYGDYLQDVSDVFDKTDLNKDDFIQSYLDYFCLS